MLAEKIEYKGFTIKIETDDDPESPREWDNLGTMVCWHRRYNLGDEQPKQSPEDWLYDEVTKDYSYNQCEYLDNKNPDLGDLLALFERDNILLPLYLYDHSGITMSTSRFHDPWDSGQVGFIYASKKAVKEEYGWKRLTAKRIQKIEKYLEGEVETYDQYLTGDVYGILIDDSNGEEIENCWGFYGLDYAIQEAKDVCDYSMKGE